MIGTCVGCFSLPVLAGEWTVVPSLAINETASSNVFLSDTDAKSGLVSDVTPAIRIDGVGDRSNLHVDYQMHNLFYSVDPTANNQLQNSLNAFGSLEAVDQWLFIDAGATIAQQSISAFGAAPSASNVNTNIDRNVTETTNYRISPYIRGAFGSFADYLLRFSQNGKRSDTDAAYDSDTQAWAANVKGKTRLANLGWSIDGTSTTTDQGNLRNKDDNRVRAVLSYQIDPQLQVSLIGGVEENNYESLEMKSHTTSGAGFSWSPTERTQLSFSRENRFFGPSNTLSFSHRTAHTAWSMSSSEDVTNQDSAQSYNLGTFYNLYYSMLSHDPKYSHLTPSKMSDLVNKLLYINGISSTAQMQGGFLTTQTVLQKLQTMSFALIGSRNTVTFAATKTQTQNMTLLNGMGADLGSGPSTNNVDQLGGSINWSHQLSPLSSLIGSVSHLNSKGTGGNTLETTLQSFGLNLVTQLGPKTSAGLGFRRVLASGSTDYSESAVSATLSHQF